MEQTQKGIGARMRSASECGAKHIKNNDQQCNPYNDQIYTYVYVKYEGLMIFIFYCKAKLQYVGLLFISLDLLCIILFLSIQVADGRVPLQTQKGRWDAKARAPENNDI